LTHPFMTTGPTPNAALRLAALLCYVGALRVPIIALLLPEWAFTLPTGLLVAVAIWAYSRNRSTFLQHHAQAGIKWAVLANLIMTVLALVSKGLYYGWYRSGLMPFNSLWHLGATVFRWTGLLLSVLTVSLVVKAVRGQTKDLFNL
jgi:chromate transport protein ChrA